MKNINNIAGWSVVLRSAVHGCVRARYISSNNGVNRRYRGLGECISILCGTTVRKICLHHFHLRRNAKQLAEVVRWSGNQNKDCSCTSLVALCNFYAINSSSHDEIIK